VGIPPYYPLFCPETPDNPVYMPKKFLEKKMVLFQNSTLVLKWGSKSKKEFLGKIWKIGFFGCKFYELIFIINGPTFNNS
jgi:hypothetical protein